MTVGEHRDYLAYLRSRGMLQLDDENGNEAEGQDYTEVGTSDQRTLLATERGPLPVSTPATKPVAPLAGRKRGLPGPPRPGRQQVAAGREAGDGDDTASDRVGDVNRLSGRGAYVAEQPSESRPLREYGWGEDRNDTLLVAVHAMQNQFQDVAEAVKAQTLVLVELKEVLKNSVALQEANSTLLTGLRTPAEQSSPSRTNTGVLSPNAGSNAPDEGQHAFELRVALGSLVEPKKLSVSALHHAGKANGRCRAKYVARPGDSGDVGCKQWCENQKDKLLFCLKHDKEHKDTWKDVASRLRGETVRYGKTIVLRFFGIPRSVSDMPDDVPWDLVVCDKERTPAKALQDCPLGSFTLPWHCNDDGLPFSTWQFEIFIAAAYHRCIERQTLRLHPYNIAFALYGVRSISAPFSLCDRVQCVVPTS
ncbi:unnamed protein product [Closterium sp. Yama58-4]|nr:unnamed protein product [Closterium sp. Yama58-4]